MAASRVQLNFPDAAVVDDENRYGSSQSVRVVVRIRPLLSTEQHHTSNSILCNESQRTITLIKSSCNADDTHKEALSTSKKYSFDKIFSASSSQDHVFEDSGAKNVILSSLKGYHGTIFAYGQTGSGKTHTMDGIEYQHATKYGGTVRLKEDCIGRKSELTFSSQGPGVTPRSIAYLFHSIEDMTSFNSTSKVTSNNRYRISCSYVQIYKEKVYDLLNPAAIQESTIDGHAGGGAPNGTHSKGLRMRWSRREGFFLENLFRVTCHNVNDAMAALQTGARNKIMASHQLNLQSSRSHSIFTLYIKAHEIDEQNGDFEGKAFEDTDNTVFTSKLSLVDLAGSERGTTIAKNNTRLFEESVSINKSLFTLRKVIQALTRHKNENNGISKSEQHIPYRDSKLTSLLKESLGGNASSLMIACLSSSDQYYEENLSTLDYASLAARITNKIKVNEDHRAKLIRELRIEIDFLKGQLATVSSLHGHIARNLSIQNSNNGAYISDQSPESYVKNENDDAMITNDDGAPHSAKQFHNMCMTNSFNRESDSTTSHDSAQKSFDGAMTSTAMAQVRRDKDEPDVTYKKDRETKVVNGSDTDRSNVNVTSCDILTSYADVRESQDVSSKMQQLILLNRTLNTRIVEIEEQHSTALRENAVLTNENTNLREEVTFLEAVVCTPSSGPLQAHNTDSNPKPSESDVKARQMHTASEAVMSELVELRKANRTLNGKLESIQMRKELREKQNQAAGARIQKKQPENSSEANRSLKISSRKQSHTSVSSLDNTTTAMKIGSGRLSSTGYVSKTMAKVANEMAKSSESGAIHLKALGGERSPNQTEDSTQGSITTAVETVDDNEVRLSKLLQTRSAMARDHIAKQSTFNPAH